MSWTHVKANGGMGLAEQWIFRPDCAPICSLRAGEQMGTWHASLLHRSGISATVVHLPIMKLDDAQASCEATLRGMDWEWTTAKKGKEVV